MKTYNVPVLSVMGYSGSGKTTFLEKLIPVLTARGIKLGLIKHDAHRFQMDREGKDTYRFAAAGAAVVGISSPEKSALLVSRALELDEMIAHMEAEGPDLILTEGYKAGDLPKIEVHRAATGKPLYEDPGRLLAIITDVELDTGTPLYDLEDVEGIADLIQEFMRNYGAK